MMNPPGRRFPPVHALPLLAALLLLLFHTVQTSRAQDFRSQQLRYARVQRAYAEALPALKSAFDSCGVAYPPKQLLIRIFKEEAILEVWAAASARDSLRLIRSFPICSSSGICGPKRRAGDGQVPEGFYDIAEFNPSSDFLLSLKVSYPNASDRILGHRSALGGDIYIHGSCVTIGCIPLRDAGIRALYVACVDARTAGRRSIPVHIFPWRMDRPDAERLIRECGGEGHRAFWRNLAEGYMLFEHGRRIPRVSIDRNGTYSFSMR
jgi:murein L,D-transpeptidase YafK